MVGCGVFTLVDTIRITLSGVLFLLNAEPADLNPKPPNPQTLQTETLYRDVYSPRSSHEQPQVGCFVRPHFCRNQWVSKL